jgi:hypothetical protein
MAAVMNPPALPTLPGRLAGETVHAHGLRAFTFLVQHGLITGGMETETLNAALHVSQQLVGAPDMTEATRDRYAVIRRHLLRAIADRNRPVAPAATTVTRPRPIVPPNSPARLTSRVPVLSPSGAGARPF